MHKLPAAAAVLSIWTAAMVLAATPGANAATTAAADPRRAEALSDAPESRHAPATAAAPPPTYAEALRLWRGAADINAWIGARFEYDMQRALLLSETQRAQREQGGGGTAIIEPAAFYAAPSGVCVDLARFGVETLRAVAPQSQPGYLMIEFAPLTIAGQTLRRHWIATYREGDALYAYADSKRPGHIAGPYATTAQLIADYAAYRGREIVSWREVESYARRTRTAAAREPRQASDTAR
jgi:hypothetical protein